MRLIDADVLIKQCKPKGIADEVWKESNEYKQIINTPTIDAVEVIRCKDCEFSDWYKTLNGEHRCYCMVHGSSGHTDDDYCSYGEREESEVEE